MPDLLLSSTWVPALGLLGSVSAIIIIITIITVIMTESSSTPINKLIMLDCLLRLTNIPHILYWTGLFSYWGFSSPIHCSIRITFSYAINLTSRLLGFSIVIYRWVCACHPSAVLTSIQKKGFFRLLSGTMTTIVVSLTAGVLLNRESYSLYHKCRGQPWGPSGRIAFDLPFFNPVRFGTLCAFLGSNLLTPFLYGHIFSFRRHQNQREIGLSGASKEARARKNLVTARFHFLIWVSELFIFLALLPSTEQHGSIFTAVFLILNTCCSPGLYFVGIQKNRDRIRALVASFTMRNTVVPI